MIKRAQPWPEANQRRSADAVERRKQFRQIAPSRSAGKWRSNRWHPSAPNAPKLRLHHDLGTRHGRQNGSWCFSRAMNGRRWSPARPHHTGTRRISAGIRTHVTWPRCTPPSLPRASSRPKEGGSQSRVWRVWNLLEWGLASRSRGPKIPASSSVARDCISHPVFTLLPWLRRLKNHLVL
jgi:hypothetical protein